MKTYAQVYSVGTERAEPFGVIYIAPYFHNHLDEICIYQQQDIRDMPVRDAISVWPTP